MGTWEAWHGWLAGLIGWRAGQVRRKEGTCHSFTTRPSPAASIQPLFCLWPSPPLVRTVPVPK